MLSQQQIWSLGQIHGDLEGLIDLGGDTAADVGVEIVEDDPWSGERELAAQYIVDGFNEWRNREGHSPVESVETHSPMHR